MGLKEKISDDMKSAMKARDEVRVRTLRMLRAGLLEKEIEVRGSHKEMTAEDEMAVLTSAVKKRKESIELFEKGGRAELVAEEKKEMAIVQEYLPRQLTADEITPIIRNLIAAAGASSPDDFRKVMPLAMKELKGKADGKMVQETVKKLMEGG